MFRSDTLGAGKVSLAFALRFRAPDRTLTDDEVGEMRRRCIEAVAREHARRAAGLTSCPSSHRIRARYAEVDGQGVVFNAHWLTYFDETCTRFVEIVGFRPRGSGSRSST